MKVVINRCYGGFCLSKAAEDWLLARGLSFPEVVDLNYNPQRREHPLLVECVETLGQQANTQVSNLRVVEIPDGVKYTIEEYDGIESIHEVHREWS